MKLLSRNEPCWCGSGKKYKQCHLQFDSKLLDWDKQGYPTPPPLLIKNQEIIAGIERSAVITTGILDMLTTEVKEGVTTAHIDKLVYDYTRDHGGIPAPLNYNGYEYSSCTSINDVICHGMPNKNTVLKDGDIVNVDISTILDGYFSDSSRMYMIGNVNEKAKKLVDETYQCMMIGIEAIQPFRPINDIGTAIETYAKSKGYSVVRDLGGHGIGLEFHENPHINHFMTSEKGMIMAPGMVFTVEPMINEKGYDTETLDDGWTVMTVDKGLSAQWEHTILVTENGYRILT